LKNTNAVLHEQLVWLSFVAAENGHAEAEHTAARDAHGEDEEEVVEMRIGSRANGKGGGGGRAEVSVQRLRTPLALDMDS
jgi:hypothetical protein